MQGLEGVRVLELGGRVSAPVAAKMMADLGADVVKIEPPEGDRARRRGPFPPDVDATDPDLERSGLFLALNTNKRGITLDLTRSEDRQRFDELVASADLLVHNHAPKEMEALGLS